MSRVVSPYDPLPPINSTLLRNPPDAVPPTDELEGLHAELKLLRQRTLERAKKAGEDLKIIEESMRRLKEKEKGKAKALEKVKKERGFTPLPNGDDAAKPPAPTQPIPPRPRVPPPPPVSVTPTPTPAVEIRKSATEDAKKKKKKRKREELSDAESEPPKARKTSPMPPHTHPHPPPAHVPPPKPNKYPSASLAFSKPANGPDFALPPQTSLLPTRPQPQPVPIPGPSKPTDVEEDFSKSKAPGSQTQITTFYASIEPWLRPIKEEDIGFLEYTGDDVEPFVMPKLGRHYSEVWEEEDTRLYGGPLSGTAAMRAPARMAEERGHGPLTERLVTALIPMHNATEWKGVKAAEEAMEGRPGTNGAAAAAARDKLNVADLEDRVTNVLRFHGLLDELPNFSEAVDDPIATALRHAQRELRSVLATNKVRRTRLTAIARDRLGYQEYVDLRDTLDKNITTLYTKLQKKDGPKANKSKKKKGSEPNGLPNGAPLTGISALPPCPAALGLTQDEENRLSVPEQLKRLVDTRQQWVETIGGVFEEKDREQPGRIWGFPKSSVYADIEEDVRQETARLGTPSAPSSRPQPDVGRPSANGTDTRTTSYGGKGKQRASGDYMDIG
ncbi:histone acetyltransferases subunit 3-domain-containing protein [Fomitopsis serialis]|uniref:histone acetyltransferases subunit 3-domain-containing protein n=1 Tax=Fomitopsis serialis TaxID=139415 RepID=UPI0020078079|nr:histone acetyltransferases subunit 3-domain-containing protein [Neoantrodia serialis]KAH9914454.1 histone acetyltransferases subunit 3-domain-containing protein [Neoantrodia serialis]